MEAASKNPAGLTAATPGGELVLNPEVVTSIVALLAQADNPDTDVQRQLATSVAWLKEVPEAQFYLACILVDCTGQPVPLRQRAGLLLKAAISKFSSGGTTTASTGSSDAARGPPVSHAAAGMVGTPSSNVEATASPSDSFPPAQAVASAASPPLPTTSGGTATTPGDTTSDAHIVAHVIKQTLRGVCDVHPEIRSTAGSILTTLVGCRGVERCADIFPTLMSYLSHPSEEVVDGAFGALVKILEDELQRNGWAAALFEFCCSELLPRLFELASPEAPLNRRLKALTCLNLFAASHRFGTEQGPHAQQFEGAPRPHLEVAAAQQPQPRVLSLAHFNSYWTTLGFLAMSSHAEVRQRVLAGLVSVTVTHSNLVCQNLERLLPFAIDCIVDSQPYDVKLEALDFLSNIVKHKASYIYVGQALPQLLLLLLQNMRFSHWDYMHMSQDQLEDDNAESPDSSEVMAPRFYRGRGVRTTAGDTLGGYGDAVNDAVTSDEDADEEDDDQPHGSTWGEYWTVRKAAALLIDQLASIYRDAMLPHVLSLIEVRLQDPEWEVRESAVLALGAIARGCINGLEPFLPRIIEMLFKTSEESKPILRSISVWTLSRFSVGCASQPAVLKAVAGRILSRVMDRNKKVQETACSAFACLEEEAGDLLLPYFPEIVDTLRRALLSFQANSVLVLLDTIGTMAESIGPKVDNPLFVEKLCDPLVERWARLDKQDPTIIATFECLTCICLALKSSLPRYAITIVRRVAALLQDCLEALSAGMTNGSLEDDLVGCSLNLLSAMCDSLKGSLAPLLVEANLLDSIEKCCYVGSFSIKRAVFAFIGDMAEHCPGCIFPRINSIVPRLLQYVADGPVAVCNNASWAIGQIALFASPNGELAAHVPGICQQLIRVIQSHYSQACLVRNACLTMGRVALVGPEAVGREMDPIFPLWCRAIEAADNDSEKVNAFTGIARVIDTNNKLVLDNIVPYLDAFASMYYFPRAIPPPPPTGLDPSPALRLDPQEGGSEMSSAGGTTLPEAHLAVSLPPETLTALHGILAWLKDTRSAEWQASMAQVKSSTSLVLNSLLTVAPPSSSPWALTPIC